MTENTLEALTRQYKAKPAPKKPETKQEPETMPATNKQAAALEALSALLGNGDAITKDEVQAMINEATKDLGRPIEITQTASRDTSATIPTGAHAMTDRVTRTLMAGEHVYLYGPSGSGKSTLAHHVAKALDIAFHATGAVFEPFSLLGYNDVNGNYVPTEFRKAYEYGGVFLFDELDASNPEAVAVFNMALANGHCPFPDKMITKHKDFYVIAAGNTKGGGADNVYTARQALDGATLDRFMVLEIGYDTKLEADMAARAAVEHGLPKETGVTIAAHVQEYRQKAQQKGQQHLITPRQTVRMVKALALGYTMEEALESTLYAHAGRDAAKQVPFAMPASEWKK